jgi:hypothetical protein
MKIERDAGIESKYRNASIEDNLKRFRLMIEGKHDEEPAQDAKKNKEEEKKKSDKKEEQKVVVP